MTIEVTLTDYIGSEIRTVYLIRKYYKYIHGTLFCRAATEGFCYHYIHYTY